MRVVRPNPWDRIESACQNCDWSGPDSLLGEIVDLHERVAPGEPMPSGECPECRCLCQPLDEPEYERMWVVRIPITVTADNREEAIKFALDDLRDPNMEWDTFEVEEA